MYTLTNNPESARNNIGGFEVKNVISNDDINYLLICSNKTTQLKKIIPEFNHKANK